MRAIAALRGDRRWGLRGGSLPRGGERGDAFLDRPIEGDWPSIWPPRAAGSHRAPGGAMRPTWAALRSLLPSPVLSAPCCSSRTTSGRSRGSAPCRSKPSLRLATMPVSASSTPAYQKPPEAGERSADSEPHRVRRRGTLCCRWTHGREGRSAARRFLPCRAGSSDAVTPLRRVVQQGRPAGSSGRASRLGQSCRSIRPLHRPCRHAVECP